MKQSKKLFSVTIGMTLLATTLVPLVWPESAAAAIKWITVKPHVVVNDAEVQTEAEIADADAVKEVVITQQDGTLQRISIDQASLLETIKITVPSEASIAELENAVQNGQQTWLLDPVKVVRYQASQFGFNSESDSFTLVSKVTLTSGVGKAKVLVGHGSKYYLVELTKFGAGSTKVWQVTAVKEVTVYTAQKPGGPDVGPGVEGLDYDKVVKWQQNVDAGMELWRLDPLEAAKHEGEYYGFSAADSYTIVKQVSSSSLSRHGQVDIVVNHQGKSYTMVMVKPFGGRDAIWTTYKVYGSDKLPEQPQSEKVIFTSDEYASWQWHYNQYPNDMTFGVIYSYESLNKYSPLMQGLLKEKLAKEDLNGKVALAACLGSASAMSDIGIEKITVSGNQMMVYVHTKSPLKNQIITKNITFPYDYVLVDRSYFDVPGGMNITFVDQMGKVLSKAKLTIHHVK